LDSRELDQLVAQIGEELLSRVGDPRFSRAEGLNIPDVVCPGCTQRCAQTCSKKTREIVAAGANRISASDKATRIDPAIASLIDHTILRADATREDILKVCREARQFNFASVCVNGYWVPLVASQLAGSQVMVCTVVGFPLGAVPAEIKRAETEAYVRVGAQEIDMVINVGALKSGDHETVKLDIQAVVEAAHRGGATVKVIIEAALLNDNEKAIACTLAKLTGARSRSGHGRKGIRRYSYP
jgi:deoxyribose-phosphate aldolase